MTAPTLNGIRAIKVRLLMTWRGPWCAEVELDADAIDAVTALITAAGAPVVLGVGDVFFTGVIDPLGSGTFVSKATVRVIGGRGGWGKTLAPQHFVAGVLSTIVYNATGTAVGEVVVDPKPETFGAHYVRNRGPASDVFRGKDWRVDPVTGVTIVGPWPSLPLSPDAVISDFEASELRVCVYHDQPVFPGTLISDDRFNGKSYVARDVEQTFSAEGATAELWCSDNASSRTFDALSVLVKAMADTRYVKTYKYRFAIPAGGKLALQSADPDAPDLNPIEQWTGLSGAQDTLQPGTEIVVGFAGGDPTDPYVVSYSPDGTPLTMSLKASVSFEVQAPLATFAVPAATFTGTLACGALTAAGITTSGAFVSSPLAPGAPLAFGAALTAVINGLSAFVTGLTPVTLSANAAALATALAGATPIQTTGLKGT